MLCLSCCKIFRAMSYIWNVRVLEQNRMSFIASCIIVFKEYWRGVYYFQYINVNGKWKYYSYLILQIVRKCSVHCTMKKITHFSRKMGDQNFHKFNAVITFRGTISSHSEVKLVSFIISFWAGVYLGEIFCTKMAVVEKVSLWGSVIKCHLYRTLLIDLRM